MNLGETTAYRIRREFPFEVETIDPQWIVLKDGTRIAATIWRPKTGRKVPVVLEMLPYRRRDGTVFRDVELHPYLAGEGIAYCSRTNISHKNNRTLARSSPGSPSSPGVMAKSA
jgi:X-Pro dipeptidyl-peptidase (S15 family)